MKRKIDLADVVAGAAMIADRDRRPNVSINDVAAVLGVAPSALYHHVGGVDELRRHLAAAATEHLADRLRDSLLATSGPDAVHAIAQAYRRFATECPGQFAASTMPSDGMVRDAASDRLAIAHGRVVELFARVACSMGLTDEPAVHWGRTLRSAVHGFVALESIDGFVLAVDRDVSFDHLLRAATGTFVP